MTKAEELRDKAFASFCDSNPTAVALSRILNDAARNGSEFVTIERPTAGWSDTLEAIRKFCRLGGFTLISYPHIAFNPPVDNPTSVKVSLT